MASRVVPATSETMVRRSQRMALISDDLPAFGRPTTATLMGESALTSSRSGSSPGSVSGAVSARCGAAPRALSCALSLAASSAKPRPWAAEVKTKSAKPSSANSPRLSSCLSVSALLRTSRTGTSLLWRRAAMLLSMGVRWSRQSQTNMMRSAAFRAMSASRATCSAKPSSSVEPMPPVSTTRAS